MVRLKRWLRGQGVHEIQSGLRTEGHPNGNRAVQFHNGRWGELRELAIERGDARPVGVIVGASAGVASGDGRLQYIRSGRVAELVGAFQRGEAATYEKVIPERAILVQQRDRFSRWTYACPGA
jgi:hypothetical protein